MITSATPYQVKLTASLASGPLLCALVLALVAPATTFSAPLNAYPTHARLPLRAGPCGTHGHTHGCPSGQVLVVPTAFRHRPSARRPRFASACTAQQAQDKTATTYPRAVLVTGANKGQGFALCRRILAEHTDTRVFLCSRDAGKGQAAAAELAAEFGGARLCLVPLDVTDSDSVARARQVVGVELGSASLHGLVSNAGVMWGHSRQELFRVCAAGVRNVLDAFLPLCADGARVVIVSSGLSPLMLGYASEARRAALTHPAVTWETIQGMMAECLAVADYAQDVKAQVLNLPALLVQKYKF